MSFAAQTTKLAFGFSFLIIQVKKYIAIEQLETRKATQKATVFRAN